MKAYKFEIGDRAYVECGNRINKKKLEELRIGPFIARPINIFSSSYII